MTKKVSLTDDVLRKERLLAAKKILKDIYPCFVLITSTEPKKDGKMQVEMDFEGDEDLASMITEHATQIFDERITIPNSNKG